MKTTLPLISFAVSLLTANILYAQNYQIDFAGSGASTTVDSVRIQNITECIDTVIAGSDILVLSPTTGINEIALSPDAINVYPNPMTGNCAIAFEATASGETSIELFTITGQNILSDKDYISKGQQIYYLKGISSGVYLLKISSEKYSYLSKIVSNNAMSGTPELKHIGINEVEASNTDVQKTTYSKSVIVMQFNLNDTLKLIGISGIYRTIIILEPTQNQTVTFNFVDCTDADGNHYTVVQIGTQIWMAENLKATKFRDGSSIPNVPDSASWTNETMAAYCNYHDDPAEGAKYGHLYNWYSASDARNIAPVGWHVSADSEWTTLINFLGGQNIAGQKIKENCTTRWAYLDTTWGTNSSGFTALCSNFRSSTGAWSMAPNNDHDSFFWTSTNFSTSTAYTNALRWCYRDIWRCNCVPKKNGSCIRCVHD